MLSFVLLVSCAWFVIVAALFVRHGASVMALWREPTLACPVVIVESDDWGVGPDSDAEELDRIARTLAAIRDAGGHPAVMTLGVVSGHPDGARILASGLKTYHRHTLREPGFAAIVEAMRAGCEAGVFALQWHGLEHLWPAALMARAREDLDLQAWLADPGARSESLPSPLQSRWTDASRLPSSPLDRADVVSAVCEEAAVLEAVFGSVPGVAVPNTFVWNDDVEQAWVASGVRCIVTPGRRFEGRSATGGLTPPTRTLRNGERTASGAVLVVRDDYFEPIRGHKAEQVWAAVERKTRLGRPTLLETHRESFVASHEVTATAHRELERALRGVLERHPETRFMSTETLAAHLLDPHSQIREQDFGRRFGAFLRRLHADATLRRPLKFSGAGWVLMLVAGAVDRLVPNRSHAGSR